MYVEMLVQDSHFHDECKQEKNEEAIEQWTSTLPGSSAHGSHSSLGGFWDFLEPCFFFETDGQTSSFLFHCGVFAKLLSGGTSYLWAARTQRMAPVVMPPRLNLHHGQQLGKFQIYEDPEMRVQPGQKACGNW